MNYKFTVFTPVFNRINEIHRVWESLNAQTFRDFEWIIVDDGSTDNVWPLLEQYKKDASFPVILLRQENKGKHFAWNRALDIANGELFVPADSDDTFLPHTLQFFDEKWNGIPLLEKSKYSGINVLCKNAETGKIVGNEYPTNGMISNNLELYYKFKIIGEKWGCVRTDVLKEYKFPEVTGRGCYNLNYTWYSIAKKYISFCFNEPLRVYYTDGTSITNTFKKRSFDKFKYAAPVWVDYLLWHLNNNRNWMIKYNWQEYFKSIFNLGRNSFAIDMNFYHVFTRLKGLINKMSFIILYFPSYLYYKFIDLKN